MSSPLKRQALLDILTFEHRVKRLALKTFRLWLPTVQAAALPTLAATLTLPPDPAAIGYTQAQWETALDEVFMSGMSRILTEKLVASVDAGPSAVEADTTVTEWRALYLQDVRNRMVGVPDSVFREVTASLDEGIADGEGIPELRTRVEKQLSNTNQKMWAGRAETVARTESAGAYNATTLQAARLQQRLIGDTEELHQVWLSSIDGRTRRSHAAADGQRAPLGGTFRVGRAELRYPGDPRAPAGETINCRCAVTVINAADPLPGDEGRQSSRAARHIIADWGRKGIVRARDDSDGIGVASAAPPEGHDMAELRRFSSLLMPLGVLSRDRQYMAAPEVKLMDTKLPLAFKWQRTADPGHDGALTVAALEEIEIRDNAVWGSGVMLESADADEAVDQAAAGVTAPSVEFVARTAVAADEDGNEVTDEQAEELFMSGKPIVMKVLEMELVAATLVSVPNFRETTFVVEEQTAERDPDEVSAALAASAKSAPKSKYQDTYLAAAFEVAEPDELVEIHVDSDGRVSGHLFPWDGCHMGVRDHCQAPYRSQSANSDFFHQSSVLLDNGKRLRVGRLTVGGGHGPVGEGMGPALEHYDNVATCWAFVKATEGKHGLWVSGMVNKQAPIEKVRAAATAPHSAHWERVGGFPELIAAHAVNSPGFPIMQKKMDRDGDLALVASMAPRHSKHVLDTSILRDVARQAVGEYVRYESARKAAFNLQQQASQRRRARANQIGRR
ncbi:phage minor head protein [Rhodococcus koreensis]